MATGDTTMTRERLKRLRVYDSEEALCFSCGFGMANADIIDLIAHDRLNGRLAKVTAL